MKLSIIIVTYNSEKYIENCINSILNYKLSFEYEICFIDNNSTDNTIDILENYCNDYCNFKVIKSENRGFNYANNIGIKNTSGELILLLNPDTIILENSIEKLVECMEKKNNIGALGCELLDKDMGKNVSRLYFPSIKDHILRIIGIRNQNSSLINANGLIEVESPTGAVFMFKREIIDMVGLMDSDYFLYFDELDYAKRILNAGKKNYVYSKSKIIHLQGMSTVTLNDNMYKINIESYNKFLNKHCSSLRKIIIKNLFFIDNLNKYIVFSLIRKEKSNYYKKNILNIIRVK
ncbi:TPA: glycosyltransferase family 2 protein [Clostridium perfringens]|nr:glycosyltransferase family 2 protein [Clostridium perfringens]